MFPRVSDVQHLKDYQVRLTFTDGTVAELDLHSRFAGRGGVFKPLQSVDVFAQVAVDKEAGTLVWPGGVDLCPDVLYAEATGKDINDVGNELSVY